MAAELFGFFAEVFWPLFDHYLLQNTIDRIAYYGLLFILIRPLRPLFAFIYIISCAWGGMAFKRSAVRSRLSPPKTPTFTRKVGVFLTFYLIFEMAYGIVWNYIFWQKVMFYIWKCAFLRLFWCFALWKRPSILVRMLFLADLCKNINTNTKIYEKILFLCLFLNFQLFWEELTPMMFDTTGEDSFVGAYE